MNNKKHFDYRHYLGATEREIGAEGMEHGLDSNGVARIFWADLVLSVIVVFFSLPSLTGLINPKAASGIALVLATAVFFSGGWLFIRRGWQELKMRKPGMMVLISLAVATAYAYSIFAFFSGQGETMLWELATLITIMLFGLFLELKAVRQAGGALREIVKLLPDKAEIVRSSGTEDIPLEELRAGDVIRIRPGGRIPADARVVAGESEVDESMVTGEARPAVKKINDEIIAGTLNQSGFLDAEVVKIGSETFLAGVMRLVAETEASKSRLQLVSDQAAFYLTLIAISGGLIAFLFWIFIAGDWRFAVERAVSLLVAACPHALGLAVPLVASISVTLAAENGFFIRRREALEGARNIGVVVFDKTGTLTRGSYKISKISLAEDFRGNENDLLRFAVSLSQYSEHLASRAIVAEAKERGLVISPASDFRNIPGKGMRGMVKNREIVVGGYGLIVGEDEKKAAELVADLPAVGTINFVFVAGKLAAAISFSDEIKKESFVAVQELRQMGIEVTMITGDRKEEADDVAAKLGIQKYFWGVQPEEKGEKIEELKKEGRKVMMVGDGINDAPALVVADVGVAVGAGTNVAIASAGIILVRNDPRDIPAILKLSAISYRKMIENLFWATGYNVFALPLAGGVLAFEGVVLAPAVSAVLMTASTLIVAVNALLMRRAFARKRR